MVLGRITPASVYSYPTKYPSISNNGTNGLSVSGLPFSQEPIGSDYAALSNYMKSLNHRENAAGLGSRSKRYDVASIPQQMSTQMMDMVDSMGMMQSGASDIENPMSRPMTQPVSTENVDYIAGVGPIHAPKINGEIETGLEMPQLAPQDSLESSTSSFNENLETFTGSDIFKTSVHDRSIDSLPYEFVPQGWDKYIAPPT